MEIDKNEFDVQNGKLPNILNEYFMFNGDDVELGFLKRTVETNPDKYKLDYAQKKETEELFRDILSHYEKTDFNELTFPYLKKSLAATLSSVKSKFKNSTQKGYFLSILFSNLSKIKKKLFDFYFHKIKENNFGLPKALEGVINPELCNTNHYVTFVDRITNWYVKNEFIYFFLHFLNDFFEIRINFDENDYSVDKNYQFSMKVFMKKSFYKLSGFMLSKLSGFSKSFFMNKAVANVNYKHLAFLFLGSFTYGISLNKFITTDFKPYAIIVILTLYRLLSFATF